jgi:hypothetical protein
MVEDWREPDVGMEVKLQGQNDARREKASVE